jgi:hypothetical protein
VSLSPLFADISSNNNEFAAQEYRHAGHILVGIKATEGLHYVNPEHRPWSYDAHIQRVAVIHYHFARPDLGNTPEEEARFFLEVALPLAGGRDYMALDLERGTPQGWSHDPAWSQRFDKYVLDHSRFHTILYASRSTLQSSDQWLVNELRRIWDADYGDGPDYAPPGYRTVIRQQSGVTAGRPPYDLPGVGPCDVDVARGEFWNAAVRNFC